MRATYLEAHKLFLLETSMRSINEVFHRNTYLVGSCLERPNYRDVDIRTILSNDEYNKVNPQVWWLLDRSVSVWLSQLTGLLIDYQIQSFEQADEYGGKRNPLFMSCSRFVESQPIEAAHD